MSAEASARSLPGEVLLHPLAWGSLLMWFINDHIFKGWLPGTWTGKLSDVACLIAFPLLLVAGYEVVAAALGARRWRSPWVAAAALGLAGFVMASINVWPLAAEGYERGLGLLQWPFLAAAAWWGGAAVPGPGRAALTMDPGDLWTLPALLGAAWVCWRRAPRRALRGAEPLRRRLERGA